MKVTAFNGSARMNGNTTILLNTVLEELREEGIETELVHLSELEIKGCTACYQCWNNKDQQCAVDNDDVNELVDKMVHSEGIILGSPTYFADITSEMKALVDRAGMVSKANEDMLKRKVGAAVVVARRAGSIHAFDSLNHFFFIGEMIVPGASYWNVGFGREIGEVAKDEEALGTMKTLGQNMAWLMKKIYSK
ncbi:MAG: flavodoxin family protein [Desulfomonile tiedjei]|uniref:Flavodoxin family protein n=1 Tax=Desulfomonile tiedjei TaxID=2358 RepID=A0A9D6Z6K8_9BACT|nr:flavodoxin family protein [Desulfomonile tiedjei]